MNGLVDEFRRRKVRLLYYYAPVDNVASVLRHGILSRNLVLQRHLRFADFSLPSAQQSKVAGRSSWQTTP